jgi:hypothetical protein
MKITALATISAITGASAQLSKKPLRGNGAKDLEEDEAAHKDRVLQGSVSMSMIQGTGEYAWDSKWQATTTTEATDAGDWSDWKGSSKGSKTSSAKAAKSSSKDWWSSKSGKWSGGGGWKPSCGPEDIEGVYQCKLAFYFESLSFCLGEIHFVSC